MNMSGNMSTKLKQATAIKWGNALLDYIGSRYTIKSAKVMNTVGNRSYPTLQLRSSYSVDKIANVVSYKELDAAIGNYRARSALA
ncbi:MAG: hypothetical protein CL450_09205 [Acidimicrobiaceae bacterium]|nr:hypothetical protein [Acidimicrobiaceae bacterium]